jgi:hypothetical protein
MAKWNWMSECMVLSLGVLCMACGVLFIAVVLLHIVPRRTDDDDPASTRKQFLLGGGLLAAFGGFMVLRFVTLQGSSATACSTTVVEY